MVDLVVDPGTVYEVPPEGLTVDNLVVHGELICDGSELVVNNRADIYGTLRVINGSRFSTAYIYSENAVFQFLDSILEGWKVGTERADPEFSHMYVASFEARRCTFYSGIYIVNSSNVTIEDNTFFKDSLHRNSACIWHSNRGTGKRTGSNWTIRRNTIIMDENANAHGMVLHGLTNSLIEDNRFEDSRIIKRQWFTAMWVEDCQNLTFRRNKIYKRQFWLFIRGDNIDLNFETGANANIGNVDYLTKNPAFDRVIYVFVKKQNYELTESDIPNPGAIYLNDCNNFTIRDIHDENLSAGGYFLSDSVFENITCYTLWGAFWTGCQARNITTKILSIHRNSNNNRYENITTSHLMFGFQNAFDNEIRNISFIGPVPETIKSNTAIKVRVGGTNNRIINADFTQSEASRHIECFETNVENYLINPVGLDLGKVSTSSTSYLYIYNTLDVSTRNPDGTPLPNVPVVILDDSGEVVYQGVTDAAGTLPRQELLYAVHNSGSYALKGPYTIRAEV